MKIIKDNVDIIGNNHEYPILQFWELKKSYQDWMIDIYHNGYSKDMDEVMEYLNDCIFVVYKNTVYNLSDTMKCTGDLGDYGAYNQDTYFSGQLFKFSKDTETVLCYSFYS